MNAESGPLEPPLRGVESLPGEGEVHVWRISLSIDRAQLSAYECGLSEYERERCGRLRYRADADKFIASHGALRTILAAYAGVRPGELEFSRSAFGKPSLISVEEASAGIMFNMTDSGEIALVAVSNGREVGVDIERMKTGEDLTAAALQCFCGAEMDLFRAAHPERQAEVFYTLWSRKEAYVKARGEGMSLVLRNIDVSALPVTLDRRWTLADLTVDREYRGAVALDGKIRRVTYRAISMTGATAPV
jgi:4'-phosphopantetheinyl transferase